MLRWDALLWFAGMGRIRRFGLTAVLLVGLAATGCSIEVGCPAIGWSNSVNIHLNGNAGEVAGFEVCADSDCVTWPALQEGPDEPLKLLTLDQLSSYSPAPASVPAPFSISRVDEWNWQISLAMTTPDKLTVHALSATGQVLAEKVSTLEWLRVGGSERCGGPGEAGPVNLDIPS